MIKILKYGQVPNSEIFARVTPAVDVEAAVSAILTDVRTRGDQAVLDYTRKFDAPQLEALPVSSEEIEAAFAQVEPEFLSILEEAAENIRAFHSRQVRQLYSLAQDAPLKILPVPH